MKVYEVIEKLIDGDISYIRLLDKYDYYRTIEEIMKSSNRKMVISKCIDKLINSYSEFAFWIVCDLEDYKDFCLNFLNSNFKVLDKPNLFGRYFIGSTKWSLEFIKNNINLFSKLDNDIIYIIIRYAINIEDKDLINLLLYSDDLDLRGEVMVEVMDMAPMSFMKYYDDIVSYFTIDNDDGTIKVMAEKYVSRIAYEIVNNNLGINYYDRVKDFVLSHYDKNSLAERLDGVNVDKEIGIEFYEYPEILFRDIDELFRTSSNYKFRLYVKYSNRLSKDIRESFCSSIREYTAIDEEIIEHIFSVGLGDKFLEYTKKYMELSTGAKVVGDAGRGSCTRSFIVGDYVVKCSFRKWTSTRCPDSFVVAKNYEEDIVRTPFGMVIGALEVQKYYKKPVNPKSKRLIDKFCYALKEMGYSFEDNVMGLDQTPNLFYLDSYKEADCDNPEQLPKWFKKNPIVLVDRDKVIKLSK